MFKVYESMSLKLMSLEFKVYEPMRLSSMTNDSRQHTSTQKL